MENVVTIKLDEVETNGNVEPVDRENILSALMLGGSMRNPELGVIVMNGICSSCDYRKLTLMSC